MSATKGQIIAEIERLKEMALDNLDEDSLTRKKINASVYRIETMVTNLNLRELKKKPLEDG